MTLCLMIYNLSQYDLQELLKTQDDVLPKQLNKQNPTTNIQPLHQKIISYFGANEKQIYDIPIELMPDQIKKIS